MDRMTTALAGFFLAALVAAAGAVYMTPFAWKYGAGILSILSWLGIFFVVAAVVAFVLGAPAFLLFLRFKLVRWWSALGSGMFIGMMVSTVMGVQKPFSIGFILNPGPIAVGGLSGLAFWFVWAYGQKGIAENKGPGSG